MNDSSKKHPPLPPWQAHPELPAGDIGWRMGYGEDYLHQFWGWVDSVSEQARKAYIVGLCPIPQSWKDLAFGVHMYPFENDDYDDPATERAYGEADAALEFYDDADDNKSWWRRLLGL